MFGIQRYFRFDAPPLRLLRRMAPASSARGSASAPRDGGPGAAGGSSVPFIAPILLLALTVAAMGGNGLVLARRLQSRLDTRPRRCPDSVGDALEGQGLSRPVLPRSCGDRGNGAGAARGGPSQARREAHPSSPSHFDRRAHCRHPDRDGGRSPASNRFQALSTLLPPRGSSVTLLV